MKLYTITWMISSLLKVSDEVSINSYFWRPILSPSGFNFLCKLEIRILVTNFLFWERKLSFCAWERNKSSICSGFGLNNEILKSRWVYICILLLKNKEEKKPQPLIWTIQFTRLSSFDPGEGGWHYIAFPDRGRRQSW